MKNIIYKCTCNKKSGEELAHLNSMYTTTVDGDGVCVYCGHYAFAVMEGESHIRRTFKGDTRTKATGVDDVYVQTYSVGLSGFRL